MQFEDISIVGLEVDRTRPSSRAPAMREMSLRLSASPPREWMEIFENERSFARHNMWRRAWIEGHHVVVDCVPEEIERYHLRDLKEDVANSNLKYREYMDRVAAEQERQLSAEAAEKAELATLRGKLKFD